jgi:hypothetical protein
MCANALGSGWQRYLRLLTDVSRSYYATARDMIASYVRCTAGRGDEAMIVGVAMLAAKRRADTPATTEAKLRGFYLIDLRARAEERALTEEIAATEAAYFAKRRAA